MANTYLDPVRLEAAKDAYTTRRVDHDRLKTLIDGTQTPSAGDLVLARVVEIGQHEKIEHPSGRRAQLFPDDEILVCYGNRYAPDQFEAHVPPELDACDLVAGGGVASRMVSAHEGMDPPTAIEPIGLVGDADARVFNLRTAALPPIVPSGERPFTIAVVGTSMNAGKTTAAAHLVRGLARSGRRVGAAKLTGTGAGKDPWLMADAGASLTYDFVDAGHPSTYMIPDRSFLDIAQLLTAHLAHEGMEAVVLEIADGLYQRETGSLLEMPAFQAGIDIFFFAAGDAMGGAAGVSWLQERNLPVRGLTGLLTASPLAIEEASAAVDVPVLDLETLSDPGIAERLMMKRDRPTLLPAAAA